MRQPGLSTRRTEPDSGTTQDNTIPLPSPSHLLPLYSLEPAAFQWPCDPARQTNPSSFNPRPHAPLDFLDDSLCFQRVYHAPAEHGNRQLRHEKRTGVAVSLPSRAQHPIRLNPEVKMPAQGISAAHRSEVRGA
jgi:hypothetical protein